ncbi:hypothetical protein [Streptomyces sp. NPDC101393]|uniref:hypothetical protein n=1 Tax=Streptomyces sp. NPDC101393 TaxID=3366141 RepID=UPI0038162610
MVTHQPRHVREHTATPVITGERCAVLDPAAGETFDEAADQQPKGLDAAVVRAREAWRHWRPQEA